MIEIQLKPGRIAIADEEDREIVSRIKWFCRDDKGDGSLVYAIGHDRVEGKRVSVKMHRLIMQAKPGQIVDHVNGNGLDNRRANLRICTNAQNVRNSRKMAGTISKYKGIVYLPGNQSPRPWRARIRVSGKQIWLGRYFTEEEAARNYDYYARRYFGEYARPNFQKPLSTLVPVKASKGSA
jgi:hypothetical protein